MTVKTIGSWLLTSLALALCACRSSDKVVILAVPADVSSADVDDQQLRERLFSSECVMFLGVEAADGVALVDHFRARHGSTTKHVPLEASMTTPLSVSTPLIVEHAAWERAGLCLILRARPGAPWRRMPLDTRMRRDAAASGRLLLPRLESLPRLW